MTRIRLNKGGLYPTVKKQAGYKDSYFKKTCSGCGKTILKKESNRTIPDKDGVKHYHLRDGCLPKIKMEVRNG